MTRASPVPAWVREDIPAAPGVYEFQADAGTTLHAVRVAHVVERVERLLEGTELDLGAIARMVGIGSASRLIELFRRMRGTTPGAFRASRTQRTAAR